MKLIVQIEIDVKPNNIPVQNLPREISSKTKDIKEYFENSERHEIDGMVWTGEKVISVSRKL